MWKPRLILKDAWTITSTQHEQQPILLSSRQLSHENQDLLSKTKTKTSTATTPSIRPYSNQDILFSLPYLSRSLLQLLVWDGTRFQSFHLLQPHQTVSLSYRNSNDVPLFVHALLTNFPQRFQPNKSPPLEILWSGDDSVAGHCVNDHHHCPSDQFVPLLMLGSVPKNTTALPTVRAFPNPYFTACIYEYRIHGTTTCPWDPVQSNLSWEDLPGQIIWRGSDFSNFLLDYLPWYRKPYMTVTKLFPPDVLDSLTRDEIIHQLFENQHNIPPRWIGVAYTLLADDASSSSSTSSSSRSSTSTSTTDPSNATPSWVDIRFANTAPFNKDLHQLFETRGMKVTADPISSYEMSQYRYQIDLAGGGGTTWDGTLTKLQMPGVLFHHETPFQDWFYDEMIPWIHYIPVHTDLSNLFQQYQWAEANPDDAQQISQRATKLANYLLSEEYLKHIYESLYVDYLGSVVDAYENNQERTWSELKAEYEKLGYRLYPSCDCHSYACTTEVAEGSFRTLTHVTQTSTSTTTTTTTTTRP
jgi:hypothetical protein